MNSERTAPRSNSTSSTTSSRISLGMTTLVETPDIPLVSMNHRHALYTDERPDPTPDLEGPFGVSPSGKDGGDNVGFRLARRKLLLRERRLVADLTLCFAIIGLVLMGLHIEMCMTGVYNRKDLTAQLVKLCISISTTALLGAIAWYHTLDTRLFMCDNSLGDWRLAISPFRVTKFILEFVVCAVHPVPVFGRLSVAEAASKADPAVDVYLSIPMLLRVYLVARVILLHSKLYTDASSQSLGALNRVHFNATFIFRSLMNVYPEYLLTLLMLSVFLISSWTMHACEAQMGMLNAMWLIAITFLTVGYGDFVPVTYCGRGVAVMAGMFGTGCTALVVAVLAQKLELTRGEKFVHNFVLDVELDKRYRVAAANIVKAGWMVYKNKNKSGKGGWTRHYQRKLLRAIHEIRDVKQEQRRIAESGVSIVELFKAQSVVGSDVQRLAGQQAEVMVDVGALKDRLEGIEQRLDRVLQHLEGRVSLA